MDSSLPAGDSRTKMKTAAQYDPKQNIDIDNKNFYVVSEKNGNKKLPWFDRNYDEPDYVVIKLQCRIAIQHL